MTGSLWELHCWKTQSDGAEALKKIEKEQPDLILLDLNIPEINGLELLQMIRQRNLPCKVIVVSCYEDFDTVKKAMRLGAVDYIRKFGLSKEELLSSLKNVMEMPVEVPSYLQQSAVQSSLKMRKKLQEIPEEFLSGQVLSFYMLWKYSEEITDMKIVETVACQYYQKLGRTLMSVFYEGKLLLLLKEETTQEEVEKLRKLIFQFITKPVISASRHIIWRSRTISSLSVWQMPLRYMVFMNADPKQYL
ncbi:MAG: response regulator [Clostridium sp.]